ncbi:MAG: MATE family efflux transporter [Oscillospiraceae bacterium]|nr:MATE family efflux transporter [Oscillospiraceae bacterium]
MANQTDLTQGGVRRQLIRYALPVIATTVMQTVYSLVDLLVVSRLLGTAGASGVSNSTQITLMLTNVAVGLSNGGNILVSQYFGAKDRANREKVTGTFLTLFALVGLGMSALCFAFAVPMLRLIKAPAMAEATAYLRTAAFGMVFVALYNCLASVLRAVGNSKRPMRIILFTCIFNLALDLLFVGPLGLGTAGAALATVLSQALSFVLALLYLLRNRDIFSFDPSLLRPDGAIVARILKLGIPNAVQMLVASISWLTVAFLINGHGVNYSAASAYAGKVKDLSSMFIIALSNAAAVMIAQTLGAGLYDRALAVLREALKLSLLISAVLVVLIELTAPYLASAFTDDAAVIAITALNIRIEILGQMFYAIFLIYHSLMIWAGDTYMVLLSSFVNCILFRVPVCSIANALFGVVGVFVACAIAPASSIVVGWLYTRSNHWRRSIAR